MDKAEKLRASVLQKAIQGKLVAQNENDEPASVLIERIKAEKAKLVKEKKIKKEKELPPITDEEKPFVLPQGWVWVRLGDVATQLKAGGDKPKKFSEVKVGEYIFPVIANGFTNNGIIGYTDKPTIEYKCLTVSGRGTIGFTCVRNEPFCPIVRLLVIEFTENILIEYIKIAVEILLERGVGTSIKQLTVPMLSPKLIPLPPLEEQQRILEKVHKIIPLIDEYEKLEKELTLLDGSLKEKLKSSVLQEAIQGKLVSQDENDEPASVLIEKIQTEKEKLIEEKKIKREKPLAPITDDEKPFELPQGWEWVRFGDIMLKVTDGAHTTPKYVASGVPFLSVKDMSSGKLDFSDTKFISEDEHKELFKGTSKNSMTK